ncbi:MAG: TonB-dependent outer membrane protein SusC/RagA, conserved site [Gemmatimonadetes bacterium]|nr:TonB-dependent outer membrane protein SusC/RagA, conserved site [Gemmatimonadota bacterium]
MYTRRVLRSFSARSTILCCLTALAACHSSPGGPVLPGPAKDQVEVGYGSQRQRDVNGAVSGADADKMMANSPRTVSDMLVGRFAGVEVRKLANGGTSIRIRGSRSFKANQEPLLVLDGTPQHNGSQSLMDLDPHDIKSIEVLKDAAASAVYGSRGSNGVILISTKRGS